MHKILYFAISNLKRTAMKKYLVITMLLSITLSIQAQQYTYEVPQTPWEESFGNHRTLIYVNKTTEVASLNYLWRRADHAIHNARFLIINAETGETNVVYKRDDENYAVLEPDND